MLPIGVATRISELIVDPWFGSRASLVGRPHLDEVADSQTPTLERSTACLDDRARVRHGCTESESTEGFRFEHRSIRIEIGHVDRKSDTYGVNPSTLWDDERTLEFLSPDEPVATVSPTRSNFGTGQYSTTIHEPGMPGWEPARIRGYRIHIYGAMLGGATRIEPLTIVIRR
jgi:hypothetical protein